MMKVNHRTEVTPQKLSSFHMPKAFLKSRLRSRSSMTARSCAFCTLQIVAFLNLVLFVRFYNVIVSRTRRWTWSVNDHIDSGHPVTCNLTAMYYTDFDGKKVNPEDVVCVQTFLKEYLDYCNHSLLPPSVNSSLYPKNCDEVPYQCLCPCLPSTLSKNINAKTINYSSRHSN